MLTTHDFHSETRVMKACELTPEFTFSLACLIDWSTEITKKTLVAAKSWVWESRDTNNSPLLLLTSGKELEQTFQESQHRY